MKSLVYYPQKQDLLIKEKEIPKLSNGEALVRVIYGGICGSDITIWKGGFKRIVNPVTIGHEITGVVKRVNEENSEIKIGDRVVLEPVINCGKCEACRSGHYNVCRNLNILGLDSDGGFTEYVKIPIKRLHKIPQEMSFARAALAEPTAVAVHMTRGLVKMGDTVIVFGAGPIGILVAMASREAGALKVMVTDINDYRLEIAEKLGFDTVDAKMEDSMNKIKDYFGVEGADVSFELAASPITLERAIDVTKIRGSILVGGVFKSPPSIDIQKVTLREQKILGARTYTSIDFQTAINLLSKETFLVDELISKKVSLDEAVDNGFHPIINGENVMKVLIDMEK